MENKIKELRKERGLSIDELAEAIGTSRATINNYENNKTQPTFEKLSLIADSLGVEPTSLWGENPNQVNKPINDIDSRAQLMVNLDDKDKLTFEPVTIDAKRAAISINQIIEWIDSKSNILYTDKHKKSIDDRQYELALLKVLNNTFQEMNGSISIGLNHDFDYIENNYGKSLNHHILNFQMMNKFSRLDEESRDLIIKLADKLAQNKKASDD